MPLPRLPDALVLPKFWQNVHAAPWKWRTGENPRSALVLSDRNAYRNEQILKEEKEITA